MPLTSTERSRKHAERHPDAAAMRKRKQRTGEHSEAYTRDLCLFWAKHCIRNLNQMPTIKGATKSMIDDAIKQAKDEFENSYYKMDN